MPAISHHNGMDEASFTAFADQLDRYVRDRLIPAEPRMIEANAVPADILTEMRDMGLFGITIPEDYGGAGLNVSQYVETIRRLAYAAPAYRSTISIGVGMVTAVFTIQP